MFQLPFSEVYQIIFKNIFKNSKIRLDLLKSWGVEDFVESASTVQDPRDPKLNLERRFVQRIERHRRKLAWKIVDLGTWNFFIRIRNKQ